MATNAVTTDVEFETEVEAWLATARHRSIGRKPCSSTRRYSKCLLVCVRAVFKTFIAVIAINCIHPKITSGCAGQAKTIPSKPKGAIGNHPHSWFGMGAN
jgi:hypothetical protein